MTGNFPAEERSIGAKMVCFGRVGSAQNPDLWGPDARVPGVTPAAAPACGSDFADGKMATRAAKAVVWKRILGTGGTLGIGRWGEALL
jgi:hypothetical protein